MKEISKLYSGWSILHEFLNRDMVLVDWHKSNTEWNDVDYKQIVKDYDKMDESQKARARVFANEFFTRNEINRLRRILKEGFDTHLVVEESTLPIDFIEPETGKEDIPYWCISYASNTIRLYDYEVGHKLPFEVCGYFDIERALPSSKLPLEMRQNGKEYLEKALKVIMPTVKLPDDIPDDLIEALYNEEGLYVGWLPGRRNQDNPYPEENEEPSLFCL